MNLEPEFEIKPETISAIDTSTEKTPKLHRMIMQSFKTYGYEIVMNHDFTGNPLRLDLNAERGYLFTSSQMMCGILFNLNHSTLQGAHIMPTDAECTRVMRQLETNYGSINLAFFHTNYYLHTPGFNLDNAQSTFNDYSKHKNPNIKLLNIPVYSDPEFSICTVATNTHISFWAENPSSDLVACVSIQELQEKFLSNTYEAGV